MQIKLIFTRKVVHLASFWKWGFLELGGGLFTRMKVKNSTNDIFTRGAGLPADAFGVFTAVTKLTPGISCKKVNIKKPISTSQLCYQLGYGLLLKCSAYSVDSWIIKIALDTVQNIGHVPSAFLLLCTQKAVILLQTIASQKYPAACLPEERTHLLSSHEKVRISRECSEDFLKTWKNLAQEIFQSEDCTSKIARKLTRTSKQKSHFL